MSVAPPLPRGKLPVGFVHAVDALTTDDKKEDEEEEEIAEETTTSETNEQTPEEASQQSTSEKAVDDEASEEEEEESTDDNDEGWITPRNIDSVVGTAVDEETEEVSGISDAFHKAILAGNDQCSGGRVYRRLCNAECIITHRHRCGIANWQAREAIAALRNALQYMLHVRFPWRE